jgi:hypothetical protein
MWTNFDGGDSAIFLCLHELHRLMIDVDDCLCTENVMPPLAVCLYNGLHLFFISRLITDDI